MSDRADYLRRIEQAIATMEPLAREAFLMRRILDLSYPQISERLEIPVYKVERCVARALVHIDRELEKSEPGHIR